MQIIRSPGGTAFVEFACGRGEKVYVYPGKMSPLDIVIKYRQYGSRERTPKHIHWAVDLLLKKQVDTTTTNALLDYFINMWSEIRPLKNEKERNNILPCYSSYPLEFNNLDSYGFYSVEFLVLLVELLMRQEKTNNPDAYMFNRVLNALRSSQDLFQIISHATFRGK